MKHGRSLGDAYSTGFDHAEFDALVEALGRRAEPDIAARALAVLADPAVEDWREIFAVQVLGEMRYGPAVGPLVAKFDIDADVLRERTADA